jgi:single-stranded-DNA-specific exonuclease
VQRAGLEHGVAAVLARRASPPEAAGLPRPVLRDLLPDPPVLKDMDAASARIAHAVKRRERIAVFADYDVDGGSSAALLITWLRQMGHGATLYVPDRIDEGYGPNEAGHGGLAETHDLIVCVDCGTLSHGPIAAAKGAMSSCSTTTWPRRDAARLRGRGEPQPAGRGRRRSAISAPPPWCF